MGGVLILAAAFFWLASLPDSSRQAVNSKPGIPAYWLSEYFNTADINASAVGGLNGDPDHDGLTNYQEYVFRTHPLIADTDDDGVNDGQEVASGADPLAGIAYDPSKAGTRDLAAADPNTYRIYDNLVADGLLDPNEINSTFNFNKPFVMPVISEAKLKIVPDNGQTEADYAQKISEILTNEESQRLSVSYSLIFTTDSAHEIGALKTTLDKLVAVLYAMPVPKTAVESHKNQIIFFEAMKASVLAREKNLSNPGDLGQWGEIMYQTRVMAVAGGSTGDTVGEASQ